MFVSLLCRSLPRDSPAAGSCSCAVRACILVRARSWRTPALQAFRSPPPTPEAFVVARVRGSSLVLRRDGDPLERANGAHEQVEAQESSSAAAWSVCAAWPAGPSSTRLAAPAGWACRRDSWRPRCRAQSTRKRCAAAVSSTLRWRTRCRAACTSHQLHRPGLQGQRASLGQRPWPPRLQLPARQAGQQQQRRQWQQQHRHGEQHAGPTTAPAAPRPRPPPWSVLARRVCWASQLPQPMAGKQLMRHNHRRCRRVLRARRCCR